MPLNNLSKVKTQTKKRLGRGHGSGRGKTAGRGTKGQKARGKVPSFGIGGGLLLYKKLPYKRGWARHGGNPKRSLKPVLIKTSQLNNFKKGTVINVQTLVEAGLIKQKDVSTRGIKLLAQGELTTSLTVELPVSAKVRQQVEQVGGKIAG